MRPDTQPILIAAAVAGEVEGLIQGLTSMQSQSIGGRTLVSGFMKEQAVGVVVTGPGIANTVQSLTAVMEHWHPALIVQTGCAGAFQPSGLEIGDIGIAVEDIDVQLGIQNPRQGELALKLPFPILKHEHQDIHRRYPLDKTLAAEACSRVQAALSGHGVRVKRGPFVTVATVTATDPRAAQYFRRFAPLMETMEGAGAAHVALHYRTPLVHIRAASNRVGIRARQTWDLPLAFERCAAAVRAVVADITPPGRQT